MAAPDGPVSAGASPPSALRGAPATLSVVVVEDDEALREDLVAYLSHWGYSVQGAADAAQLWRSLALAVPDLVILDLGLPDEPGLEVLPCIRKRHPALGIMVLSAFSDTATRIMALQRGADLYLVKDASLEVIGASCAALCRRLPSPASATPAGVPPPPLQRPAAATHWTLHSERSALESPSGRYLPLSHMELTFLQCLMRTPGLAVSRAELLNCMGRESSPANARNLDGCIARLRRKAVQTLGIPLPVHSHYGQGYVFLRASDPPAS